MLSKRPCRICRRWFLPSVRAGKRQRVCSEPGCQRERHRRNCADWHRRNPGYDQETRLRRRLVPEAPRTNAATPLGAIDEDVARDAVGVETYVVTSEIARLTTEWVRDVVGRQVVGIKGQSGKLVPTAARDEIAPARAGP